MRAEVEVSSGAQRTTSMPHMRSAPAVGQDNALVYGEWLGYGAAGVERLRAEGII